MTEGAPLEVYSTKCQTIQQDDNWRFCVRPACRRQGWKIYVSATVHTMGGVLAAIEDYLSRTNTPFKHIKDSEALDRLNAGWGGYSQIGKSIVVYAENRPRDVMRELRELVAPFRDSGPTVPFARAIGAGLPLSYRYGAYRDARLRGGSGAWRKDCRESRELAVPADRLDVFADLVAPGNPDKEADAFLSRFAVFQTLAQSGKSGVFLAIATGDADLSPVIVKIGYKNGAVSRFSDDGRTHVRREIDNHLRIEGGPLQCRCPRLVSYLANDDVSIVVTTYIPGIDLALAAQASQLRVDHVAAAWSVIEEFHASKFILTDPKLANFILHDDRSRVSAIDLEMLRPAQCKNARLKRTFSVKLPRRPSDQAADKIHFIASIFLSADPYARERLGVVELADVVAAMDACADAEVSEWARRRLAELLKHVNAGPIKMTRRSVSNRGAHPDVGSGHQ